MAVLREIVFHCERPSAMARFWAQALDGYEIRPYDDAEIERLARLGRTPETDPSVAVDGPGPILFFSEVPETGNPGNHLHLDLIAADRSAEVERLVSQGASVVREFDSWTIMRDPEGNEFCVADPR
ncbi:VOC family protein [Nonomuraea sp. CA-143628]|uniref:VOC family protein n=1 Tax=Nonomuraea sp. CA-143628 TaxID=3239997 RepID=UPI003D91186A